MLDLMQVVEKLEREMGLEPTNSYGAHSVCPQTGMKTGVASGYRGEPRTIEVDDVWQYKSRPRIWPETRGDR